ncbi:hypothetical protein DFH09DRAFT_1364701 [Mycena vulgaris]|nr:hypothetical protein DFH09DRAFT_1364701 [Mycena vulgaris]
MRLGSRWSDRGHRLHRIYGTGATLRSARVALTDVYSARCSGSVAFSRHESGRDVYGDEWRHWGILARISSSRDYARRFLPCDIYSWISLAQPARTRGLNLSSFGDNDDGHSGDQGIYPVSKVTLVRNPRDTSESWENVVVRIPLSCAARTSRCRSLCTTGPRWSVFRCRRRQGRDAKRRPRTYTLASPMTCAAPRRGFDPAFHASVLTTAIQCPIVRLISKTLSMMGGDAGWTCLLPPRLTPRHLAASLRSRR